MLIVVVWGVDIPTMPCIAGFMCSPEKGKRGNGGEQQAGKFGGKGWKILGKKGERGVKEGGKSGSKQGAIGGRRGERRGNKRRNVEEGTKKASQKQMLRIPGLVPKVRYLAHQHRTIAIASDFRVDGAKSPEILQKERVWGS